MMGQRTVFACRSVLKIFAIEFKSYQKLHVILDVFAYKKFKGAGSQKDLKKTRNALCGTRYLSDCHAI